MAAIMNNSLTLDIPYKKVAGIYKETHSESRSADTVIYCTFEP